MTRGEEDDCGGHSDDASADACFFNDAEENLGVGANCREDKSCVPIEQGALGPFVVATKRCGEGVYAHHEREALSQREIRDIRQGVEPWQDLGAAHIGKCGELPSKA